METNIEEIRREFRARGLTVTGWARAQGFSTSEVYALLNGRTRGNWGRSHAVAVALGLKSPPDRSERFQSLDSLLETTGSTSEYADPNALTPCDTLVSQEGGEN